MTGRHRVNPEIIHARLMRILLEADLNALPANCLNSNPTHSAISVSTFGHPISIRISI